jgi:hypothetical protein
MFLRINTARLLILGSGLFKTPLTAGRDGSPISASALATTSSLRSISVLIVITAGLPMSNFPSEKAFCRTGTASDTLSCPASRTAFNQTSFISDLSIIPGSFSAACWRTEGSWLATAKMCLAARSVVLTWSSSANRLELSWDCCDLAGTVRLHIAKSRIQKARRIWHLKRDEIDFRSLAAS